MDSEVGGQDPCPQIGSLMGNQALIVPRLLLRLALGKTPSPWIEAAKVYCISLK